MTPDMLYKSVLGVLVLLNFFAMIYMYSYMSYS